MTARACSRLASKQKRRPSTKGPALEGALAARFSLALDVNSLCGRRVSSCLATEDLASVLVLHLRFGYQNTVQPLD